MSKREAATSVLGIGNGPKSGRASPTPGERREAPAMPPISAPFVLLRLPEVRKRLNCSMATVRRRIDTGQLRASQHGRILTVEEGDLAAFIRTSRKWR
jgi:hypothetical protein